VWAFPCARCNGACIVMDLRIANWLSVCEMKKRAVSCRSTAGASRRSRRDWVTRIPAISAAPFVAGRAFVRGLTREVSRQRALARKSTRIEKYRQQAPTSYACHECRASRFCALRGLARHGQISLPPGRSFKSGEVATKRHERQENVDRPSPR
jgi:hypothetical protein